MPVALIAGAFGQGNPGDEALLDAHLRVVHAAGWDAVITASEPRLIAHRPQAEMIAPRGWAAASACRRADAVLVGGGTVFGRLHPSTGRAPGDLLRRTAALTAATRAFGHPIVLSGVGAAPVVTAQERALVRGIVRASDMLVLRDEESADVLRAAGAPPPFRVGADPAWTVVEPITELRRDTGVLLIMSHLATHRGLIGWLAAAIGHLAGDTTVAIAPWQRRGPDVALTDVLARRLAGRAHVVDAPCDMTDGVALASTATVAVCLRFHGAMASALARTPFVAVGHEPKLQALARRLGAPCVAPGCSPIEMARAVHRARERGPASRRAIDAERRRAFESMGLVRLVLSQGSAYEDAMVPSLSLVEGGA